MRTRGNDVSFSSHMHTHAAMTHLLRRFQPLTLALVFTFALIQPIAALGQSSSDRWSAQKANEWYEKQPWLVGANFIPSDAINQLEMFQAATFDPSVNEKELGLAESIGMNTMRVFLQDQLWQQDPDGFKKRLDTFLSIAAKHHIKPVSYTHLRAHETDS